MIRKIVYVVGLTVLFSGCTTNYKTFGLNEYDDAEEFVTQMMTIGNKVNKSSPKKQFFYNEDTYQFDTLYVVKYREY